MKLKSLALALAISASTIVPNIAPVMATETEEDVDRDIQDLLNKLDSLEKEYDALYQEAIDEYLAVAQDVIDEVKPKLDALLEEMATTVSELEELINKVTEEHPELVEKYDGLYTEILDLESELEEAQLQLDDAQSNLSDAQDKLAVANKALEDIIKKANNRVDIALDIAQKEEELTTLKEAKAGGYLGLLNFLANKEELPDETKANIELAKNILNDTTGDFVDTDKDDVKYLDTKVDFANGAGSLDNLKSILAILEKTNEYRTTDDNNPSLEALRISPALMATSMRQAQSHADTGIFDAHLRTYNVAENIAFGYEDANDGWYVEEKKLFDENGKADKYDEKGNSLTGHYKNIINSDYTVFGGAIVDTNDTEDTELFTIQQFAIDGKYAEGSLSVEEFKALVEEYSAQFASIETIAKEIETLKSQLVSEEDLAKEKEQANADIEKAKSDVEKADNNVTKAEVVVENLTAKIDTATEELEQFVEDNKGTIGEYDANVKEYDRVSYALSYVDWLAEVIEDPMALSEADTDEDRAYISELCGEELGNKVLSLLDIAVNVADRFDDRLDEITENIESIHEQIENYEQGGTSSDDENSGDIQETPRKEITLNTTDKEKGAGDTGVGFSIVAPVGALALGVGAFALKKRKK